MEPRMWDIFPKLFLTSLVKVHIRVLIIELYSVFQSASIGMKSIVESTKKQTAIINVTRFTDRLTFETVLEIVQIRLFSYNDFIRFRLKQKEERGTERPGRKK